MPQRGLGHLLRELSRAFENEMQRRLARYGITLSQWLHLRVLWDNPGMTHSAISRYLGVEKASSTAVLNGLQALGLIQRARNTEDRRVINLQLTSAGRLLTRKLIPHAVAINSAARANILAEDISTFFQVTEAMIANLKGINLDAFQPTTTNRSSRKIGERL